METSYIESNCRGYYHHRYIITLKDSSLFFIPKTTILENSKFNKISEKHNEQNSELWLIWEENIKSSVYQDGWCGPSSKNFLENTYSLLLNGEEDFKW